MVRPRLKVKRLLAPAAVFLLAGHEPASAQGGFLLRSDRIDISGGVAVARLGHSLRDGDSRRRGRETQLRAQCAQRLSRRRRVSAGRRRGEGGHKLGRLQRSPGVRHDRRQSGHLLGARPDPASGNLVGRCRPRQGGIGPPGRPALRRRGAGRPVPAVQGAGFDGRDDRSEQADTVQGSGPHGTPQPPAAGVQLRYQSRRKGRPGFRRRRHPLRPGGGDRLPPGKGRGGFPRGVRGPACGSAGGHRALRPQPHGARMAARKGGLGAARRRRTGPSPLLPARTAAPGRAGGVDLRREHGTGYLRARGQRRRAPYEREPHRRRELPLHVRSRRCGRAGPARSPGAHSHRPGVLLLAEPDPHSVRKLRPQGGALHVPADDLGWIPGPGRHAPVAAAVRTAKQGGRNRSVGFRTQGPVVERGALFPVESPLRPV